MTARDIAYDVLKRWKPQSAHATKALDECFSRHEISVADRALATELVHGVMRRRDTLSALLKPHVNRPLSQVEAGALTLLWLGAYQLVLLSGIPPYAVVNEMVELAKTSGNPQWGGFINGVLRSLGRVVTDELLTHPAANAVPLASGKYRVVMGEAFPDPARDWLGWFIAAFSLPRWMVERWQARLNHDGLVRLGFWFNAPTKMCLRANRLRTTRDELLAALDATGIKASAGTQPDAVWLEETTFVQKLPGFEEGWFAVQDESAIAAAALLDPQPGERVLDLCAAPGGKTTHLAALMKNEGRILATDVDADRLRRVEESCRRIGVTIVETRIVPRNSVELPGETFDRILLDVPCSNTGVLGKRPEVRWRLRTDDLVELPALQTRLLHSACKLLAPSGSLVYSTCSIEPEENRAVVDRVLGERPELTLVREIHHIPGRPADGGYQALVQSTASGRTFLE
jgi:16S rRNA (cytosine967-C5)-methyltransferase